MNQWMSRGYAWWKTLSSREQRLLLVTVGFSVLALLYGGVVRPIQEQRVLAQNKLTAEKNLYAWVTEKADTLTQLRQHGDGPVSNEPMNQAVAGSTGKFGVRLIRMQPKGEGLQIWVEPVAFNQFIDWLAFLRQQYGIQVMMMDIDRAEKNGMIDIKRLELVRG
ncbi:type II secretion system protein M [Vibrio spartinae]|uniref:Type II secretion system protein M n=1 Tax=Vibrio spartinae TaxID=1918945 RepID=A0A1N6M4Y9_9VIBR|nr:type II secretion system protein M [Vibrio spartinae]QMV15804.1 General secretion pathway protein M [Vibrio spartinae]SIO94416.1 Type II secretion system protein M [Vibrio spartinae]